MLKRFLSGNYNGLDEFSYLYNHPLQLGCVIGETIFIKILHNDSNIVFQILNVFFIIGIIYIIYKIAEIIFNRNDLILKVLMILIDMFLVFPFYAVVVYGNIYGLFFILLAILFSIKYMKNRKSKNIIAIIIFSIIAILFKSNYEIIAIAIIISFILDYMKQKDKKIFIIIIGLVFSILFSYKILFFGIEKITNKKVNSGIPMLTYIAMGMDQKPISRNSGWYGENSNVETIYAASGFDYNDTNNVSKMMISLRVNYFLKNPTIAIKFYMDKISSTWIEPAFQTMWWAEPLEMYNFMPEDYKEYVDNNKFYQNVFTGDLHFIILKYLDFIEILIFATTIVYIIYSFKNNDNEVMEYIGLIGFIGGFLFHILWETKCIYVIPFFILLLPYSSKGIIIIKDLLEKMYNKNKKNTNKKVEKLNEKN